MIKKRRTETLHQEGSSKEKTKSVTGSKKRLTQQPRQVTRVSSVQTVWIYDESVRLVLDRYQQEDLLDLGFQIYQKKDGDFVILVQLLL